MQSILEHEYFLIHVGFNRLILLYYYNIMVYNSWGLEEIDQGQGLHRKNY